VHAHTAVLTAVVHGVRDTWQVPTDASGYCECAGGATTTPVACEHEPFTCQKECALLRERRRRGKQKAPKAKKQL
jgi:hypothetical protein